VKYGEANDQQGRDAQQAGTTSHKIFLREFLLFDENTPDKLTLPRFRSTSAFVTRRCRTVTFSRIKRQHEFKRPGASPGACACADGKSPPCSAFFVHGSSDTCAAKHAAARGASGAACSSPLDKFEFNAGKFDFDGGGIVFATVDA
jgi:hypothetical protein